MIVIACGAYNEQDRLPITVPAILAQTHTNFRLLLLDNGSTDDTWEIMQRFASKDPRIFTHHEPSNLGSGEVSHVGMDCITARYPGAEWVVWHGADDLMDPDYVEALVTASREHPEANYLFSPWRWDQHPERPTQTFDPYDPATIAKTHQVPNWAMLRMDLWHATGGFDRSMYAGCDWDWAVRASLMGLLHPYQLPRAYLALHIRTGRVSQSGEVNFEKLFAHMQRHQPGAWATWSP